jgi:RNA polymerase sigma-70 factor (ECF subfamily)
MADTQNTKMLVSRIQAGDEKAREALCRRYQERVLAAVRIRLGAGLRRKCESMDIVQEAMADAFRNDLKSFEFESEGAFLRFLNQVVENNIRDEARKWAAQKRDQAREADLASPGSDGEDVDRMGEIAGGDQSPSGIIGLAEDLSLLEEAMDLLGDQSDEYRELIIATKIEGLTYVELADQGETSPDAIRMKTTRAMEALAKIFQQLSG